MTFQTPSSSLILGQLKQQAGHLRRPPCLACLEQLGMLEEEGAQHPPNKRETASQWQSGKHSLPCHAGLC